MAPMQILSILLIACLWNGCDGARIQCKSGTVPVTSDLPAKIELPPIYTASIRYSYWNNRTNTLIEEQKLSKTLRIKRTSQAINDAFIISNTNTTINFNETWCSTVSESSQLDGIYGMPEEVKNQLKFNGYSIESLIKSILAGNFTQKFYSNDTVALDGIEAVLWIGCMPKIGQGSTSMQVEVAFAGENSSAPYSARVHNPVALSVNILLYNESDPRNITNHISFDIVQLDVPKSEQDLVNLIEVPRGVYCEGMKSSEIQAKLPDKFEAAFDYTDVFGKFVNDIHMFYDGAQRIISFGMNVVADRDAPFIGNVSLPKDFTMVNIIHDFKYGLQYIIDAENSECKEVKGIDAGFGDVITMPLNDSTTKQLDMKSPQQILMNISNSQFYLHGRRLLEDGIEVDVYVSRSTTQTPQQTYTVVELLFAAKPWRLDALETPYLHSIIQYHKNESGHELGRTIIRLHAFRNGTEQASRWTSISAYPCLKLIEDSYLYVNIKNSSLASLEKLGLTDVENTLREAIANASGVSVLRVANFFFKQIQDNVVVFFVIGEASGVAPAETRDRLNETSAIEAQHQLNSTLMERDISFMVPAGSGHPKTELKLARTSLGVIPSKWSPSPGPPGPAPFNGYTGGSMFVLAVFMLMLGVAIGVGGMFFIWKRQRLSGLAYQVFE